jgi:hypothetical protein
MTHGNVDYIWWKWQQRSAANQYDFRAGGGGGGGGFPGGGGSAARGNICDKLPYTSAFKYIDLIRRACISHRTFSRHGP